MSFKKCTKATNNAKQLKMGQQTYHLGRAGTKTLIIEPRTKSLEPVVEICNQRWLQEPSTEVRSEESAGMGDEGSYENIYISVHACA